MPGSWDGKSRPSDDKYRKGWDEVFGKKEKDELDASYQQSKRNKKERMNKKEKDKNVLERYHEKVVLKHQVSN